MRWCKKTGDGSSLACRNILFRQMNEEPSPVYSSCLQNFLRIQETEAAVSAFIIEVVIIIVAVPVFVVIVVRVDLAL